MRKRKATRARKRSSTGYWRKLPPRHKSGPKRGQFKRAKRAKRRRRS